MMLKWLIAAVIIYGGLVALLYLAQRSLQYFPERRRTALSAVGLTKALFSRQRACAYTANVSYDNRRHYGTPTG